MACLCRLDIGNLVAVGKKPLACGPSVVKMHSATESMKSIRFRQYGEPAQVLEVGERPVPEPGQDEARVRTVDALGPGVADLAPGQRVSVVNNQGGNWAEYSKPRQAAGTRSTRSARPLPRPNRGAGRERCCSYPA